VPDVFHIDSITCDTFITYGPIDPIPCVAQPPLPPNCVCIDTLPLGFSIICCIDSIVCDTFSHVDTHTDTAVYVYGTNNSVWALNANTGTTLWNRTGINAAAASLNSGSPIVFDTLLIIHDNGAGGAGRRFVSALNTRNGATVWTSNDYPIDSIVCDTFITYGPIDTLPCSLAVAPTPPCVCIDTLGGSIICCIDSIVCDTFYNATTATVQLPFRMFLGLSLSNDTLFVSGRGSGISSDGGGQIVSLDAKTGLRLDTYDPTVAYGWQHSPVVFEDRVVAVSRNDAAGSFSGTVHRLSHDLATVVTGPGPAPSFTSIGFVRFSTPTLYVEPSVGEKIVIYGTIGQSGDFPPGDIVMRRILPTISLRSYQTVIGQIHGPGAVAAGNGLLLQGDDAGYWWAMDANSYGGAFFGGLYPFWIKQFPSHITAGAAISPEDDTLVVIIDGNGNAAGWHNGHVTTRPRAQIYFDYNDPNFSGGNLGLARTEVVIGIIPTDAATGNGGFAETTVICFQNVGNAALDYELSWGASPVLLSSADFGGTINWSRISPGRGKIASRFVEENTITSGNGFMEKKYDLSSKTVKDGIDMEEDGIQSLKEIRDFYQKTAYFGTTKLQEAKSNMPQPGWLFVNELSPNPVAPGDSVLLRLVAVNPNVGFGLFFGQVKLHSTNEPDVQGNPLDTTRIDVILAIGYLGQRCHITPDDDGSGDSTNLLVSNYGHVIAQDAAGFHWKTGLVGFDGGYELGNSDTTFVGMIPTLGAAPPVPSAVTGWKSDADCEQGVKTYTEGSVSVDMDTHYTAMAHLASAYGFTSLPLIVKEYGWAFREAITPHAKEAIFKTLVVSCTGSVGVDSVKLGAWADLDVHNFGANNSGLLANNDVMWQYDVAIPEELYGIARVPGDNVNVSGTATLWTSAHATAGGIEWLPHDPVEINGQFNSGFKGQVGTHPQDLSIYNGSRIVSLAPGESYTVTYIWWGADTTGESGVITTDLLKNRLKEWLRLLGYYRGDVWGDGGINVNDKIRLGKYVYPFPAYDNAYEPIPFASQGELNNDGIINFDDVILLKNFQESNGATTAPLDRDRFVPDPYKNVRDCLNDDVNWTP
jgi:hypothetical protein